MTGREPAWRVLANEFEASIEEEKGTGERAAGYVLSPIGARMNRVLAVGTLAPPESVGRDPSATFLRARLTDPTGSFQVTAGGFQPRALAALQRVTQPGRALVVGKAHLFRGRDQVVYGSLRAEALRPVGEEEYRGLLAEAIRQTARRIDLAVRVRAGRAPLTETDAHARGIPSAWLAAAHLSQQRYPTLDPEAFRPALLEAAAGLAGTSASSPAPPPASPPVRVTRAAAESREREAPSAAVRAEEAAFLDIVDELAEGSADGYADLREAILLGEQRGVRAARTEELLSRLEESGVLEEPVVGKLRRA